MTQFLAMVAGNFTGAGIIAAFFTHSTITVAALFLVGIVFLLASIVNHLRGEVR